VIRALFFLILAMPWCTALAAMPAPPPLEPLPLGNPWKPPALDPARISKADYLEALRPYLAYYEKTYGNSSGQAMQYAYEAVPAFAAFWKATNDPKYADLALEAITAYARYLQKDLQDRLKQMREKGETRPPYNTYWPWMYAFVVIGIYELEGAPQQARMKAVFGEAVAARAAAFPVYWEHGAQNRTLDAALWYEIALRFGDAGSRAKELRKYADDVWNEWWTRRDIEEDCSGYTPGDLLVLDAWSRLRGVAWWEDPDAARLWRGYTEQISNDGTWPAYGNGANHGEYSRALYLAELTASKTREPRYKWLAHRAFWNGRDRLTELMQGIGYEKAIYLALAYLYADDAVREAPPLAGVTLTQRRFRERTDWSKRTEEYGGPLFVLHERRTPSKLIFRSGPAEKDAFLLLQAGSVAGHGHPDTGSVLYYGSGFAYHLSHGVTRLDHDMEQHNMFTLRVPGEPPWRNGNAAVESTSVPVHDATAGASYARLRIEEFPGFEPTEERWKAILSWKRPGYPAQKAIGYRNWPVRMERSVLFVNDAFVVVRDVAAFRLAATAQMGQNWVVGNVPAVGANWAKVQTPLIYGFTYIHPPIAPIRTAPGALLIWFAPRADGRMELVDGPKKSAAYGDYYINLPRRVWYPRTGRWSAGSSIAFTSVLVPIAPDADPSVLAGAIETIKDSSEATVLSTAIGGIRRVVVMNNSGKTLREGDIETDAEAAVLTYSDGRPVRVAAWNATFASVHGKLVARRQARGTIDSPLAGAGASSSALPAHASRSTIPDGNGYSAAR
jgi:hypothetical protein